MAAADFNGDGKIDVAVVQYGGYTVSVFLGNGDGTFQKSVEYICGDTSNAIVTADFNHDGRPDLAIMAYGTFLSTVSILLGNGDGTFQNSVDYPVGIIPFWIAVGDVNGDGYPDILTTNGFITVLLNNGDGSFREQQEVYGGDVGPIAIADVNGDGKADLLRANGVGQSSPPNLSLFYGNGDGTFQPAITFPLSDFSNSIVVGDFNGDGNFDVATRGGLSISVLLGNGSGFGASASYPVRNSNAGVAPNALAIGDLNGDGKIDLATVDNTFDNAVSVLFGRGDGTFQSAVDYGVGVLPASVVASDLNGDGKDDLIVASYGDLFSNFGDTISVLLATANGSFFADRLYPSAHGPNAVALGDFNGDGKIDMALANGNPLGYYVPSQNVSVLLGNGDGTFQTRRDYSVGNFPLSVVAADINGDGRADLVTANHDDDTVSVLIANSDGTFRTKVNYSTGTNPYAVVVDDFNRDGKKDLAVAASGSNDVSILLGRGDGTFENHADYTTGANPLYVATGDFNGDGIPDLATVSSADRSVSILLGVGDGSFKPHADIPVSAAPVALVVGDFNADGKSDLALADGGLDCLAYYCYAESTVAILLGNGDGSFQPAQLLPAASGPQWLGVADLNGDGKQDLAVANSSLSSSSDGQTLVSGMSVSVFWGNGDGTFRPHVDFPVASGPFGGAIADLNDDHKVDLVIANALSDGATVLLNSWNTPQSVLAVTTIVGQNNGGGEVDSIPAGINRCSGVCNAAYPSGASVTLTAIPQIGNSFQGWSGDCSGTQSCQLAVSADRSVTATFAASNSISTLTVQKSGVGSGTVVAGSPTLALSLDCGSTCSSTVPPGTLVVVSPFADPGSRFSGWNGAGCTAGQLECAITMEADKSVTASFTQAPSISLTVQIDGTSAGQVTINQNGPFPLITCSSTCVQSFASGSELTLSASSTDFAGWAGGCSGTSQCSLVLSSDLTVSATFNSVPPDFSLSAALSTAVLNAGQSTTSTITVNPSNGFNSNVGLTCSVQPSPAMAPTCSLNPVSVGAGASSILTVSTTAPTGSAFRLSSGLLYGLWIPVTGLAFVGRKRRRGWQAVGPLLLGCLIVTIMCALQIACGGSNQNERKSGGGTPAGTYSVTVTGATTSLQHSTVVMVQVQ